MSHFSPNLSLPHPPPPYPLGPGAAPQWANTAFPHIFPTPMKKNLRAPLPFVWQHFLSVTCHLQPSATMTGMEGDVIVKLSTFCSLGLKSQAVSSEQKSLCVSQALAVNQWTTGCPVRNITFHLNPRDLSQIMLLFLSDRQKIEM